MTDTIFKNDAKMIVDSLFDQRFFNDTMTRDRMDKIEDVIGDLMRIRYESYVRAREFSEKMKTFDLKPIE